MSKIIPLYAELHEKGERFIDEIFTAEIYRPAVPQLTIIDLGAYEGEFGYYCYNFASHIYAFEPDPRPFSVMEKRVNEYNLDRMHIYNKAVGAKNEKRQFHASDHGGSSFYSQGEKMIDVDCITLPDFIKENSIEKVDILKIDVEGAEREIFDAEGTGDIIDKIQIIVGENHVDDGNFKDKIERVGFTYKLLNNCFIAKR